MLDRPRQKPDSPARLCADGKSGGTSGRGSLSRSRLDRVRAEGRSRDTGPPYTGTRGWAAGGANTSVLRTLQRRSASPVHAGLVPVSDRSTLGGLTQFLKQFGFSGSATSL